MTASKCWTLSGLSPCISHYSQTLIVSSHLMDFKASYTETIDKCAHGPQPLPYIPDPCIHLPASHLHRKGCTPNWPLHSPFLLPGWLLPCLYPRRKASGSSILSMGPAINLESSLMVLFLFHSMCSPRPGPVNPTFNPYPFRTDHFSVSLLLPSKPGPPPYLAVRAS